MSTPGSISIADTDNKLSISSGKLNFVKPDSEWYFIPLETLNEIAASGFKKDRRFKKGWSTFNGNAMAHSSYALNTIAVANANGTVEGIHILADNPTVWHITFTPPNGEPRHLEIEHDDLTPAKLAELCN